jgi:hypothetical protein
VSGRGGRPRSNRWLHVMMASILAGFVLPGVLLAWVIIATEPKRRAAMTWAYWLLAVGQRLPPLWVVSGCSRCPPLPPGWAESGSR